ncbi:MAG: 50S ribosomal protein L10 [candidate division WWE3 bacterium GW2011_GWE2_43_18]|uniref:Large ribosomal subunit protein uL10 n=1 Tax=candidate division WWE3 bacterium TaxID=2053526 RepID=A0A656PPI4_UNCKA|nr:MAG: 50S ribosomal protein L10 [candidate division WWE3 bacterium GW2011_GWB1_42_117]KKS54544.1 MAG: 50S ribosomal protein L10 [candidate division WWE3 bacterium GW2011_GWD2_42_34]KKT05309.1 MAG: 50S ribosomal protein L10 [candidate division WWE3 bacterium GW2011_GWE2_43_18]KKT06524.1 MAG: 50S ribosomal protein L10 [candidate division WWE3 bacterium GW2011_GWF2_43_18]KKT08235.1 MAG: 50S ribosomal protein L10 [candidate division WWE3 bacterium GW2011_GWD1_43_201]KKT10291.1 MAG: 50S ribosomal
MVYNSPSLGGFLFSAKTAYTKTVLTDKKHFRRCIPNKMGKIKNLETVKSLKEKVARAKSIVFADYRGLSAGNANDLRAKLKGENSEMLVIKNTLLKVALEEEKIKTDDIKKDLEGPTMAVFSFEDPIASIKTIFEFAKKLELPKIKSALIEGVYADSARVEVIKNIPSKEVLLSQVVGNLKSPLSGFVGVLGGVHRKFVYAMDAIAKKKATN